MSVPDHYPAWWCCPAGKTRVEKEMEGGASEDTVKMVSCAWLTPGGRKAMESLGLGPKVEGS